MAYGARDFEHHVISEIKRESGLDLDSRLAKLVRRVKALQGIVYRSVSPKYANSSDILSGEGSRQYGARWNPVGIAAVYGSFTPQTALAESLAHANYYQLPIYAAMPRTFVAVEFNLQSVLDLTQGRIRQALAISESRFLRCN
jgi:RES domain-containing protein